MMNDYSYTVKDRFLRYVQIDTQSDPFSTTFPSTEKQKNLSRLLADELKAMGIQQVELDDHGYVYARISSNINKKVPTICFCSHVDTAPDCSGAGVKPVVHYNYQGEPLLLPDDPEQTIKIEAHPYLRERIGDDIITASGTTLLGADDKAGVAIIMDMANFFQKNPQVPHGDISILFTPDEEVGRGVDKVDLKKVNADFGYTLDGGERGSLEDENFSADQVIINFYGVSAHPGSAKDKLVNAIKAASSFIESLPKHGLSPETTDNRDGFVHPVHFSGSTEQATVHLIIRDFQTSKLKLYEQLLEEKLNIVLSQYPGARASFEVQEQYRNMKEVLDEYPEVVEYAKEAIKRAGIDYRPMIIRGGTDGARLSFMGLPCPNLFTGEMALHSKQEYVSVQDMQKSVDTIIHLAIICAEKN